MKNTALSICITCQPTFITSLSFTPSQPAGIAPWAEACSCLAPVFWRAVVAVAGSPPDIHLGIAGSLHRRVYPDRPVDGHRVYSIWSALFIGPRHPAASAHGAGNSPLAVVVGGRARVDIPRALRPLDFYAG
mgnify:CR=1 FL=1